MKSSSPSTDFVHNINMKMRKMKNLCSIRFLSFYFSFFFSFLVFFYKRNYNENSLILYNLAKHSKHKEAYMKMGEEIKYNFLLHGFCDIPVFFKTKLTVNEEKASEQAS